MSGLGGVGYGGLTSSAIKQFQQNLFNQIDSNGDGSVSKTELEQAVSQRGFAMIDVGDDGEIADERCVHEG